MVFEKYCTRSYLYKRHTFGRSSRRRRLPELPRVDTPFLPNRIRNVLQDSEQLFAVLPHRCINGCRIRGLGTVPRKSTRSDEELTERHQPPILRCDKCLWPGKAEHAGLPFKIIFTNDPLGLTVHAHETASIHQYLKQSQVFIEPGTLSMLNVLIYRCHLCTCLCPVDTCIDACACILEYM